MVDLIAILLIAVGFFFLGGSCEDYLKMKRMDRDLCDECKLKMFGLDNFKEVEDE